MIPIPRELQLAMRKKDASESFVNVVASLMLNYHLSYSECMKLPFPMVIELMNKLKEMEKEIKRGK